jgi:hypothetical protein
VFVAVRTPADVIENDAQCVSAVMFTPFVPPPVTGVAVAVQSRPQPLVVVTAIVYTPYSLVTG